jgi:hypothetical protein
MMIRSMLLEVAAAAVASAAGTSTHAEDCTAEIAQNLQLSDVGAAPARTGVANLLKP